MKRSLALDESRPVWQTLLVFLIPLMLSNALQSLGQTMNQIYLGRMVGVHALAVVSSIFPVLFFLISFLIGLASGATVLIGQAYGAHDASRVRAVAGTALGLSIVLGIVVGGVGALAARPLLLLMGTPADIVDVAETYARITFVSLPLLFAYLVYTTLLRGIGDTRTPFYVLIVSTALTLLVTPALIAGWGGLPALGTYGAAVANILATAVSLALLLVVLARAGSPLAFAGELARNLLPQRRIAAQVVRLGVPTGLNLVMVSLSEIAVITFVNHYGSRATAAYGAVNQVVSYAQFPAISIGIAASIFGSQAIGAGRTDRLPNIVRAAVSLNYAIEGVLIAIVYTFAPWIVSSFTSDLPTQLIAHRLLAITLWSYAIFGNARVLSGLMLSSGAVLWPTLLAILSIWGVEVPVAYVLMQRFGLDGVWLGYPAAYVAGLAFQFVYYYFFWRRSPMRRLTS